MLAANAEIHILVDDFGQTRLADPSLFCVLTNILSRVELEGTMKVPFRWMGPELLLGMLKSSANLKATFANDVYSVTMTSLVFLFLVNTLLFLNFVSASDRFRYDSITSVVRAVLVENEHPDRPEDVDDELWSLWGEGWNQDAFMRPDVENYVVHNVERLSQLV